MDDATPSPAAKTPRIRPRDRRIAIAALVVPFAMLGLSYAAVPLYSIFCAATGYDGTTRVATEAPKTFGKATITVRFDANVSPALGWTFKPEQEKVSLRTGETKTIWYKLRNDTARPTVGIASFNIAPEVAGQYFNKIQCFCFTEQVLKPGESRDESVTFFVDPAIEKDEQFSQLGTITLSYTFFPAKNPVTEAGKAALAQVSKLSN